MIYLGSPYSHPDPLIMRTRFLLAEQAAAALIRKGLPIFSPIVHTHEMASKYQFPTDFEFWSKYCLTMLRCSEAMYVLKIPGWSESKGLQAEIRSATAVHIPVDYVNDKGIFIDG